MPVTEELWKAGMYKEMGITEEQFIPFLRDLGHCISSAPIIVLDMPRTSKASMADISSFAKVISARSSAATCYDHCVL